MGFMCFSRRLMCSLCATVSVLYVNRTSVYGLCAVRAYVLSMYRPSVCFEYVCCLFDVHMCVVCLPCLRVMFVYRRSVMLMRCPCVAMYACMPVCFPSHVLSCALNILCTIRPCVV